MSFLKHLIVRLPVVIKDIKYDYVSYVFMKIYGDSVNILHIIWEDLIKCYEMFRLLQGSLQKSLKIFMQQNITVSCLMKMVTILIFSNDINMHF